MIPDAGVRLLCIALAAAACTATPDPDAVRRELLAADRAFALATAERGIEGWLAYFADDGAMYQAGEEILGHEAIRRAMTPLLTDSAVRLVWEPLTADASTDGQFGHTAGRYRVERVSSDSVISRGMYLTVWRRTANGWRVVADVGSPAPVAQNR